MLPATNDRLRTWIHTQAGKLPFQEWFVARGTATRSRPSASGRSGRDTCARRPRRDRRGDSAARRAEQPLRFHRPILAVGAIREAPRARRVPAVAVSPLIARPRGQGAGRSMLTRLAGGTSPAHVASAYSGLIDALVVDELRGRPRRACRRAADRHADPDDRSGGAETTRRGRTRSGPRMKVAVLGGTGAFGSAPRAAAG